MVWGGVSFWRSLMWLDLIDEFRLDLHPYVAGEGTRLFEDVPKSNRLDLVSSTEFSNGTVGLQYRRHRYVVAFPVPGGAVVLRTCEIP